MDASFLQLLEYDPPEWARSVTEPPNRRLAMALTPTAIEPWRIPPNLLPADCQTKIFVKRDDKTGVGLSGNKVRKLEFLIADAVQQGCDCVVTIGGGIYGFMYVYSCIRCVYVCECTGISVYIKMHMCTCVCCVCVCVCVYVCT